MLQVIGAAGIGLMCGGCGTTVIRRSVQRRIAARLRTWLGPAERYSVRIAGSRDAELVLGRARRVEVEGVRILAREEFMVERLKLTLTDLRYEGGEAEFLSVRRSDLELEIAEEPLNRYLRNYHGRYQPSIRLHPDRVEAGIVYGVLGPPAPMKAIGRLEVEEGKRLLFRAESAEVPLITDLAFACRFVEERVNPVLDLTEVEFPARLESVQVLAGRLRAHGSASLRQRLDD